MASSPDGLTATAETLGRLGALDKTITGLKRWHLELKQALGALEAARSSVASLQSFLGCQFTFDTQSIDFLHCCLRLLEAAPFDVLHLRSDSLERDGISHIFAAAVEESNRLKESATKLSTGFDLAVVDSGDVGELFGHAKVLQEAGFFQTLFSKSVRHAKRAYRRVATARTKRRRHEMAQELRALGDYVQKRAHFEKEELYQSTFGLHFRGTETNWDEIQRIVEWYAQVFETLPEHKIETKPFRDILLRSRVDRMKVLATALPSQASQRAALHAVSVAVQDLSENLPVLFSGSQSLLEIADKVRSLILDLEKAIGNLTSVAYREDASCNRIKDAVDAIDQYRALSARIAIHTDVRNLLGEAYGGVQTNLEPIEKMDAFATRIIGAGLPPESVQWILTEHQTERLKQLGSWIADILARLRTLRGSISEIDALTESSSCGVESPPKPLSWYQERFDRALESRDQLPQWVHFLRVRLESRGLGLSKLTGLADEKKMEPEHLVPAFRFLFYDSLTRGIFAGEAALTTMTGLTVSEVRKQFAKLDKDAITLYRQSAAASVDRRPVPSGSQYGPVGSWTDLSLVIHEISKQRRHIPIRQMMRRAGSAVQALKPCFMMSPLSVAQYLAPGELSFDLVVMDEASQLKPEDAIGALARGGQMVIVGDPKQLPPTTFFQRAAIDAEAEEDEQTKTAAEEGESILDVASTLYQPVRRLRWHYRSRHHSLIAFSNKEFYQGDLVIFPSAYHEHRDLGVKYHPVPEGVFDNGRNAREAEVVVDAVLDHMQRRPDESLGVVTLNFEQGEFIEELLDQRLRSDPFALVYQERMDRGSEPFFIKNLENVQGDERDVIFISATYGPDSRGNQYQRFGPINGSNGHRRLNVLFTRAKKRTEVFSSLDPDKIQTGPGSAWGLRALKQYLAYARSGVLEAPDGGGEQPTNDFERSVGAVLKDKGFEVVPQVGVAGFFIDLAVKHPMRAGSYLAGIECDGASYHSGRSARDRDRLREEILVNLGWRIYRIWSTDWFRSRAGEVERLLKFLDDLLAADPDYQQERTTQGRTEELRRTLLQLRRQIQDEFPYSPLEKNLLQDQLLEEFILRRPRTKDDWFRLIPQKLRDQTDSKQVKSYLPTILRAIADSAI